MDELSELEHLKLELARSQQRAEEAEQQRQREQQRAEAAEQQRQREQQRAEAAEQQRQDTTLAEYIDGCHEILFARFAVEQDKSLTSKGSITNPRDKWCPARIAPWSGFLDQQKDILGKVHSLYPAQSREFESLDKLRGFADRFREVANEKDLEHTQRQMVEIPVTRIIEQLQLHGIGGEFDVGQGIVFESHPNIASDAAEEPRERLMHRTPLRHRDRTYPGPHQLLADQICVYKYEDDGQTQRRMAFVVEYKAPHKLTLPHLRLGLREMDIYTEVVNRASKPLVEETEALFQYTSDRLAAAAVVQTFHYMIEGGLEYSYITTGEAFIFLKIDWNHPDILYYHLAEPGEEVRAHPDNLRHCTAVSQVLAFALLAVASPTRGQRARHEATEMLSKRKLTWKEDYESILYAIPASERKQTPPPSAFEPRNYRHVDRSPYLLRKGKAQGSGTCRPDRDGVDEMQLPEPSDDESPLPDTPVQPRRRTQARLAKQQRGNSRSGSSVSGGQTRPYCTQKCLLGLVRGGTLDENCPNVSAHRGYWHANQDHLITHSTWLRLLREQLSQTLDDNVEPLWKQGARGIMFKVTLGAYGYTVLSKGTVLAFVEDLQHEAVVYRRLQQLQGVCVPVFLGSVDLGQPYYYDFQVRVIHMIFLSWGGERMGEDSLAEEVRQERSQELVRSVHAIHSMAVVHGDIREPNALWNSETGRVMVIDFERSVLLDLPRAPLSSLQQNRKRRRLFEKETRLSLNIDSHSGDIQAEMLTARSVLG